MGLESGPGGILSGYSPLSTGTAERLGGNRSMAERALRGTRLGATSEETDRNTDRAPRQEVAFDCPKGHRFTVPFSAEAEIPVNWECRVCGSVALTATGDWAAPKKAKPPRDPRGSGSAAARCPTGRPARTPHRRPTGPSRWCPGCDQ